MKPVSDFFPRILPYVHGCSEPLAQQCLVDSAIAFCEDSLVLRQKQAATTTTIGVAAYTLDSPTDQQPARVMNVWVDGVLIAPVAMEESQLPATTNAKPLAYYTTRVDSTLQLILYPAPDKAYTLDIEVALRPTRAATTLQDDLFNLWVDTIVAGTLGRIMRVPSQPFSDPGASQFYMGTALSGARKARIEGGFGRVRSSVSVRNNPFV